MPMRHAGHAVLAHLRFGEARRARRSGSGGACASGARPQQRSRQRRARRRTSHGGGIIIGPCGYAWLRSSSLLDSWRTAVAHEKFKIVGTVVKIHADADRRQGGGRRDLRDRHSRSAPCHAQDHKKVARTRAEAGVKVIVQCARPRHVRSRSGRSSVGGLTSAGGTQSCRFGGLEPLRTAQAAAFSNSNFFWLAFCVSAAAFSNSARASSKRFNLNSRSARTPGR